MITVRNIVVEHVYLACGKTDMRKSIDGLCLHYSAEFQAESIWKGYLPLLWRQVRQDKGTAMGWKRIPAAV